MVSYKIPSSWGRTFPSVFWLSSQKFSIFSKHCSLSNNRARHDASPPPLAGAAAPPSAVLTVTGKGVSCTFGPGAPDGWLEGSHCRSPVSSSCSRFACRTRRFCVALETRTREAERPLLHVPGPAPRPCSRRSVRGHPLISVSLT